MAETTGTEEQDCPFCTLGPERICAENDLAVAILDGFPVNPGHALIIPRRHIASFFEATKEERAALFDLLDEVRVRLQDTLHVPFADMEGERVPDGFNIGINDGAAAGQTVFHLHIHLIPRFVGDCEDPRGGVRKLFPDRAPYWRKMT
jgi:diadenosine tetraphosphate (Ap4A) HIT family hydrolase